MPISLPRLFRALVLAALALHVFYMYSIGRGIAGDRHDFGFDFATSIIAAAFGLAMLIPLVWAVTLPEMPEMYTRHVRARRWFFTGRCPGCGYTFAIEASRCSECGRDRTEPPPYQISGRTIRLFIAMNLLAWSIGVFSAEVWALADERAFAREAAAHVASGRLEPYTRPRWWPSGAIEMTVGEAL